MSLSPKNSCDKPAALNIINKFISAIPNSICCPFGENFHFCTDGIFLSLKVSSGASLLKSPFLFTQAPKLVETDTSGEVVNIRLENSESNFAYWSKIFPNAFWVDILVSFKSSIGSICILFDEYLLQ